jgi:uncharacterized protein YraI
LVDLAGRRVPGGTSPVLATYIQRHVQAAGNLDFRRMLEADMLKRLVLISTVILTAICSVAHADDIALARNSMLLYGGPDKAYPRVGIITWGQGLTVLGCREDAGWCEVAADGQRGWVKSKALTWPDDGQRKVLRKRVYPLRLVL